MANRNRYRDNRDQRRTNQQGSNYELPPNVIEEGGQPLVDAAEKLGESLKNRGSKPLKSERFTEQSKKFR